MHKRLFLAIILCTLAIGARAQAPVVVTNSNSAPAIVSVNSALPAGTNTIGAFLQAQPARVTGNITGNGQCVTANTAGYGIAGVTIHGTYAGVTLYFQFSDDAGVTYYANTCARTDSPIQESSEALPSNQTRAWDCGVYDTTQLQVCSSAYTSGTAIIGITPSGAAIEPAPTVAFASNVALPAGTNTLGAIVDAGTAGTPNAGVETVQGISGGYPIITNPSQINGNSIITVSSGVQKVGIVDGNNNAFYAAQAAAAPVDVVVVGGAYTAAGISATNGHIYQLSQDSVANLNVADAATTYVNSALSNAALTSVTASQSVKASAGNVYGFGYTNGAASVCWIQCVNSSGSGTLGTSPIVNVPMPASTTSTFAIGNLPLANASTGIACGFSTTPSGSTACGTAGTLVVFYK